MSVRLFEKKDYAEVMGWVNAQKKLGHPCIFPSLEDLPQFGFFCPGTAVVFLLRVERNLGLLEYFVSNPNASEEKRKKAYEEGIAMAFEAAENLGMRKVMANSAYPKVMGVCIRAKMVSDGLPYYWFQKTFEKKDREIWVS